MATLETTHDVAVERERMLALGAALLTVTLWASAFVGIRSAGRELSPGALALGRLLVGSIGLGALALVRREGLPDKRDLPGIVLCGILWFGLYSVVLNEAERRVDGGTAAMLVNVGPIFLVALAVVFLREPLSRALLIGGTVAFAGVVVIGLATTSGTAPLSGVLLCLVAAFGYAAGVVAQKPVLGRLPALQVTWVCCTIGALVCLPYAPALVRDFRAAPGSSIAWMAYLGDRKSTRLNSSHLG